MNFKSARNQRLHVELALVQLCQVLDKKKSRDPILSEQFPQDKQHAQQIKTNSSSQSVQSKTSSSTLTTSNIVKEPHDNSYYSSTPSIKNILKQNTITSSKQTDEVDFEKSKSTFEPKSEFSEIFDENQFVLAYNRFIESIKTDKPRLYSALKSHEPKLSGNSIIEIVFSNQAQQDDFAKNIKQDMTEFIRQELKNDNISIEMIISEKEQKNLLYTDEDKFKHLLAKNPSLGKLKQQLNLDFE
jgi:DNA polymerase-3 subunit gamma/tau